MTIDLHTHTTASDGSLSPQELVQAALDRGVTVMAITDHDTVAGVQPAIDAAAGSALRVLPGVEVNALHGRQSIHLLGYGIDPAVDSLVSRLHALSREREERARSVLGKLAAMGAPISWERVAELGRDDIARPHIARVLVEAGHARDIADAFARFIGDGCPAFLPSSRMSIADAMDLVWQAGGQVAVAHPLGSHPVLDLDAILPVLLDHGLAGIEVYHTEHGPEAIARLQGIAADYGLWWSGGSDFHGSPKPKVKLGGVAVPEAVLEQGPFPAALAASRQPSRG